MATALAIDLRKGTVTAEGDLDFRGTLGVDKEAPVGFRAIRLGFAVDTDAPQEKIDSSSSSPSATASCSRPSTTARSSTSR